MSSGIAECCREAAGARLEQAIRCALVRAAFLAFGGIVAVDDARLLLDVPR